MLEENDDDILEIHDLDSMRDDVTLTEYDVMIQPKRYVVLKITDLKFGFLCFYVLSIVCV